MHLKNFSLVRRDNNTWVLAPAYDLLNVTIVNPGDKEELALTINARKNKLNRKRLEEFGEHLGLATRQVTAVFNRLKRNEQKAIALIDKSFLSKGYKKKYLDLLNERYRRILH